MRVADFGIARHLLADNRLTDSGVVLGTMPYLAPEVMTGGEPGPRADLYALGVVLYEMLTSRLPFSGENALTLTVAKREHRPTPPSALVDLPTGLERIVLSAIEGDPSDRPPDAASLAAALRPFAEVVTPTYQPPLDDGVRPPPTAVTTVIGAPRHAGGQTRRPLGWLLVGLIAAAGLVATAVTLLDGRNDPTGSASATSVAMTAASDAESTTTTIIAIESAPTPTTVRPATANTTPSQGTPAGAVDDLGSDIAALLATDSIDRRLAKHLDRDAQKALRYWERGDEERAEEELRGLLDELDETQDDVAESADPRAPRPDRPNRGERWAWTSSAGTMATTRTIEGSRHNRAVSSGDAFDGGGCGVTPIPTEGEDRCQSIGARIPRDRSTNGAARARSTTTRAATRSAAPPLRRRPRSRAKPPGPAATRPEFARPPGSVRSLHRYDIGRGKPTRDSVGGVLE